MPQIPEIVRQRKEEYLLLAASHLGGVCPIRAEHRDSLKYEFDEDLSYSISDLLQIGANPFVIDLQSGMSPIMWVARSANYEGFQEIYASMQNLVQDLNLANFVDNYGRNVAHHAARGNNVHIIDAIMHSTSSPTIFAARDHMSRTPIYISSYLQNINNSQAIERFLFAGSDLGMVNVNGEEPVSFLSGLAVSNLDHSINNLVANIHLVSRYSQNDCSDIKQMVSDFRNPEVTNHFNRTNTMLAALIISVGWRELIQQFNNRTDVQIIDDAEVQKIADLREIKNAVGERMNNKMSEGEMMKSLCVLSKEMLEHSLHNQTKPYEDQRFIQKSYTQLNATQNNIILNVLTGMSLEKEGILPNSRDLVNVNASTAIQFQTNQIPSRA